jgi:hypothetical protein
MQTRSYWDGTSWLSACEADSIEEVLEEDLNIFMRENCDYAQDQGVELYWADKDKERRGVNQLKPER